MLVYQYPKTLFYIMSIKSLFKLSKQSTIYKITPIDAYINEKNIQPMLIQNNFFPRKTTFIFRKSSF
jgi:hypothetical protein